MARKIKDNSLNARVDESFRALIDDYIEASDELNMGELVRRAVREYIQNHPLHEPQSLTAGE